MLESEILVLESTLFASVKLHLSCTIVCRYTPVVHVLCYATLDLHGDNKKRHNTLGMCLCYYSNSVMYN